MKTPTPPIRLLALLTLLLLTACAPAASAPTEPAQGPSRAGLVIRYADGRVETYCVQFEEPAISGEQLLRRAGVEVAADASNPMGALVCGIQGEGCAYPAEDCLCQCQGGGPCAYWAYFTRAAGGDWAYSALGASARQVGDGDMDAWVWLTGAQGEQQEVAGALAPWTFERVCGE